MTREEGRGTWKQDNGISQGKLLSLVPLSTPQTMIRQKPVVSDSGPENVIVFLFYDPG